jgi:sialic acid synthase SpsE
VVLVIAEIGSCHDGSIEKAHRLIVAAKDAGADVAKFQFWSNADRLAQRRGAEAYREIYRRYQMPAEWLPELHAYCDAVGIEFMTTVYLPEDVGVVAPFVNRFKVASFEAADPKLQAALGAIDNPVIVSSGMRDETEVWRLMDEWLDACRDVSWLHCVSSYPAPVDALNLRVISDREFAFGFSDHSEPTLTWTGALAVAAGAPIVEAHLRLDDTDIENPDAPHAMDPRQFREYVRHIRFAETALGDGNKRLMPCEAPMTAYKVK